LDAFEGEFPSTAMSDPERFLLLLFCGDAAELSETLDFDFTGLDDVFFNSSTSTASSARYVSERNEMKKGDSVSPFKQFQICNKINGRTTHSSTHTSKKVKLFHPARSEICENKDDIFCSRKMNHMAHIQVSITVHDEFVIMEDL
jgi:hypothetical protein